MCECFIWAINSMTGNTRIATTTTILQIIIIIHTSRHTRFVCRQKKTKELNKLKIETCVHISNKISTGKKQQQQHHRQQQQQKQHHRQQQQQQQQHHRQQQLLNATTKPISATIFTKTTSLKP